MFLISETDLAAPAANFDLTNIPNNFKHLEVIAFLRSDRPAVAGDDILVYFNGDAVDANYDNQYVQGNAAAASAVSAMGVAGSRFFGRAAAAAAPAGFMGFIRFLVPGYAAAVPTKFAHGTTTIWTSRGAGGVFVRETTLAWNNAAAINRITIAPAIGTHFIAPSTVTLLGVGPPGQL